MTLPPPTSRARQQALAEGRERPTDGVFMRQALALGARNLGRAAPNPSVGAILVDETPGRARIIARAVTAPGGRPHAERLAIAAAGGRARGATLFVTLEPCAHHGRTPPCAEAVIEAGIARVVCGIEDPNPRVAGQGFALLRQAGIAVVTGVMEGAARELHAGHILRQTAGRPFVTLKLAMTADGFAASGNASPLRITGGVADAQTHLLRARADAILVGVGTVLSDDPQLTCRLPGLEGRSPIRVVFDTHLRMRPAAKLVVTARATPTWIITSAEASRDAEARLAELGVEVVRVATGQGGRVDIRACLQALGARGVTRLICEGGPTVAEALAKADLLDEVILIASSRPLGHPGVAAIGPALAATLSRGIVALRETLNFGPDRWTRYLRPRACSPAS